MLCSCYAPGNLGIIYAIEAIQAGTDVANINLKDISTRARVTKAFAELLVKQSNMTANLDSTK